MWNVPAWSWCPLWVTRATGRGQWPSVSAWFLQLTCVASVIYQYRTKELRGIKFWTFHCLPFNKNIPKNRSRVAAWPGSRFFFQRLDTCWFKVRTTMSWFHCLYSTPNLVLNLQKLQSFHSRMIELWNLITSFFFLVPEWFFLFYEAFMNSFWIKYWQRQGRTNPKVQAWGNVQDIRCHDLCCCFVDFQNFPFACASRFKLDQDNLKNLLFPSLCGIHGWSHPLYTLASMDEVIYSASGPPSCMASMDEVIHSTPAIVPAALSYLSFPAASRWTKTIIPNLWLRSTRGIWRGRRICRSRIGSSCSSSSSSRGGGYCGRLLLQAWTNLATVLIKAFAMSLKG